MTVPTFYRSEDTSAPTLSGTAGDLITVLDAILRTGYGSQPAAGWTKPYTGTNSAVFQMGAGTGSGISIDDNATGTGGAREARIRGYVTPSGVGAGGDPFPTAAQKTNGLIARKSDTADATVRRWVCLADARTFYFWSQTTDSGANNRGQWTGFAFGDFYKLNASDAWNAMIIGRNIESATYTTTDEALPRCTSAINGTTIGHYAPRIAAGTGTAVQFGKFGNTLYSSTEIKGAASWPDVVTGGIFGTPIWVNQAGSSSLRGRLRGLHQCFNSAPLDNVLNTPAPIGQMSIQQGQVGTDYEGKTLMMMWNNGVGGQDSFFLELSDTWDTN